MKKGRCCRPRLLHDDGKSCSIAVMFLARLTGKIVFSSLYGANIFVFRMNACSLAVALVAKLPFSNSDK